MTIIVCSRKSREGIFCRGNGHSRRKENMLKKKRFIVLMLIFVMIASMALMTGCGSDEETDGDAVEKDTLVVGLDDTFAPMGFRDEQGNLVGVDIDLANAVGEAWNGGRVQADRLGCERNGTESWHDRLRMERYVHHTGKTGKHGTFQQISEQQDRFNDFERFPC